VLETTVLVQCHPLGLRRRTCWRGGKRLRKNPRKADRKETHTRNTEKPFRRGQNPLPGFKEGGKSILKRGRAWIGKDVGRIVAGEGVLKAWAGEGQGGHAKKKKNFSKGKNFLGRSCNSNIKKKKMLGDA